MSCVEDTHGLCCMVCVLHGVCLGGVCLGGVCLGGVCLHEV